MATWNMLFETQPSGSDFLSNGDNEIRSLKEAIRERVGKEHVMTTGSGAASAHGWHNQGAALGYYSAAKPTLLPDGSTALAADVKSKGRMWFRAGSGDSPYVWNGSTWVGVSKELTRISVQGTLVATVGVVPPVCFTRTVTVLRALARIGTRPAVAGHPVWIDLTKRSGSTASASLFSLEANRLLMSTGASFCLRSSGQMSATKLSITPLSWLRVDFDGVGATYPGADVSVTLEVCPR